MIPISYSIIRKRMSLQSITDIILWILYVDHNHRTPDLMLFFIFSGFHGPAIFLFFGRFQVTSHVSLEYCLHWLNGDLSILIVIMNEKSDI